jgi:hypothetical protein
LRSADVTFPDVDFSGTSLRHVSQLTHHGYPIIVVSFGFVFVKAVYGKVPKFVAVPFTVSNLMF